MWQAVANMEGWAFLRESQDAVSGPEPEPQYDIIWMEQYARFVHFTLTQDMGAGSSQSASANVNASWDQGVEPPSTITVHDLTDQFKDAVEGCQGIAVRSEYADPNNPDEPYYVVVHCQRAACRAHATLTNNMCGGSPSVDQWEIEPHGDFTYEIDPGTLQNSAKHFGESGDYVVFERITNEQPFTWELRDVLLKEQDLITALQWDEYQKCLEYKYRRSAIEACEPESEWTELLCFDECP